MPEGWGKFPKLLQNYLCEASGIQTGVYPGDTFHPYAGEPYYRDIDEDGNEEWEWNLAGGSERIRYNNQAQIWEFCQSGCGCSGLPGNSASIRSSKVSVRLARAGARRS